MLHLLAMLNSFYGIVKGDNSNVLHSDCRPFFVLGYIFLFQFLFHFAECFAICFIGGMEEEKANQKERVKIPTEKLRKYFPKNYTVQQIEDEIIKLCEKNYRNKQRDAR